MKTRIRKLFLRLALIGLGLMLAGRATAQTLATLHSFTNDIDGENPVAGLVLSGNTLFGTVEASGNWNAAAGSVFAVNTDGTGFTIVHPFVTDVSGIGASTGGCFPRAGLILSDNTLYGTAYAYPRWIRRHRVRR